MLIVPRPSITKIETKTCAYHLKYPGVPLAGCTCRSIYSQVEKPESEWTDEERTNYYRALVGGDPRP